MSVPVFGLVPSKPSYHKAPDEKQLSAVGKVAAFTIL